jgi:hypothetical protein
MYDDDPEEDTMRQRDRAMTRLRRERVRESLEWPGVYVDPEDDDEEEDDDDDE